MRRVKIWRSNRVRSYVLPLLLGALALRFLVPTGFMPGGSDGMSLTVAMCSTERKKERVEIPGEPAKPHCDFCTLPSLDAPLSPVNIADLLQVPRAPALPLLDSQVRPDPLVRAQIPRAPPSA